MPQIKTGQARYKSAALPACKSGLGAGTTLFTADGELPVEFLEPGDRIITHDQGMVRLSRINVQELAARDVVRVSPSFLTPEIAARDILISAQQRLLIRDWRARAMFRRPSALVEAWRLIDGAYMARLAGARPVRLFQLVFDDARHVLPIAGGNLMAISAKLPEKQPG